MFKVIQFGVLTGPRALGRASTASRSARTPRSEQSTPVRSVRRPTASRKATAEAEIDKPRRRTRRPADPKVRPTKQAPLRQKRLAATRKAQPGSRRTPAAFRHTSPTPPPSPARVLLRNAQQVVEADAAMLGRRPSIMDVILNSRAPVSEYSEDIVMEALERSEAAFPVKRDFVFDVNDDGVEQYWADQATLWRGMESDDEEPQLSDLNRFQESAERSTASWPSDAEDDTSSPSDAQSSHTAFGPLASPARTTSGTAILRAPRCGNRPADVSTPLVWTSDQCADLTSSA